MFDYQRECEDHEAFLSKASIPKVESETSPIALLYEKMKEEYQEIRVGEYFCKGFKYAMSFVEKALREEEGS
jgi:hypothetical protein